MSKCLQNCLILTFRYSNLKSKYWKRCEVFCAKLLCVSAGSCPLCRLVLRNVNKTDISIPEQTVYYISQYRLLHQNYHCKNNETKQIHVLQQLEISKAIDGDSAMLFLLFERTTTSLSLAKLHKHIIKRYVKAIFGEYLVN